MRQHLCCVGAGQAPPGEMSRMSILSVCCETRCRTKSNLLDFSDRVDGGNEVTVINSARPTTLERPGALGSPRGAAPFGAKRRISGRAFYMRGSTRFALGFLLKAEGLALSASPVSPPARHSLGDGGRILYARFHETKSPASFPGLLVYKRLHKVLPCVDRRAYATY